MDHDKVIKTLEALIPQGAKSGPENVIIKYASEENLSPAQLERIAQMYNVAMTINFMNKSASRGDTFQLIDTAKLMEKYTGNGETKKAHVPDEWAAWLTPDSMSKAASEQATDVYDMPDIVAMAKGIKSGGTVTTQSDVSYPALSLDSMWESFRKESNDKFETSTVNQIISDAEEEFRDCAEKINDLVTIKGASLNQIAQDVYHTSNAGFKVMDKIACYLSRGRGDTEIKFDIKSTGLVRDKFGAVAIVEKAAAAIETIKAAKAYLGFFEKESSQTKNAPKNQRRDIEEDEEEDKAPRGGVMKDEKENVTSGSPGITPYDSIIANARPKGKGDGKPMPENKGPSMGDIGAGGLDAVKRILSKDTYFDNVNDFDSQLKTLAPTRQNKTQRTIDTSRNEAANVTTLQRLLITDPIISEADPHTVVDLYNTLQKANPDIASDPNVLRFALREAIQYDAVPLHTYKDFVETDQKHWQAEKDRDAVMNQRYSI